MRTHRLTFHFRLFLLFSVTVPSVAANAQELNERFPNELNSDVEEPRIPLPEVQRTSPFRRVSSSRKQSNDAVIEICKEAVDTTARRLLSTESHTPWQIMHGLLALRHEFQISHEGQSISGLDWVADGQVFDNEYWFEATRHGGRAHPYSRPYAFEGHANQFLAILSMCGVELNRTFGTSTGRITMRGMINNAQMTLTEKDEPTWTLWALSRYLPASAQWRSEDGESWSIEKLVQIQTAKPMQGAPCGGTHGLFALAHARNVYLRQKKPLRGVWLQAEYKIRKYINTARMQQNSDGTLSSNFFRSKEYDSDFNKRMASAGHILEFLMIALPQNELGERWVRRAIEATSRDLLNNRKAYVKCSPLYHSVNALNIYLDRVNPMEPAEQLATGPKQPRTAKLTPQGRAKDNPPLKSVPVTSITQSRELPDAGQSADSPSESQKKPTAGANSTCPITIQSVPLRKVPQLPESTDGSADAADSTPDSAQTKWKSTSPARRTEITIDSSRGDAATRDGAAPDNIPMEAVPNVSDLVSDLPEQDEPTNLTKDSDESDLKSQPAGNDGELEDLTVAPVPVQSVSRSRVADSIPEVDVTNELESGVSDAALQPARDAFGEQAPATSPPMPQSADPTTALLPIVDSIGLTDGMSVAEVNSGPGLFLPSLSAAVGTAGRVFAIDDSPRLVEYLEQRVAAEALTNVSVVRNDGKTLALVNTQVDRVFVCDAYRAFKNQSTMLASILRILAPGGQLIIVESAEIGAASDQQQEAGEPESSRQLIQSAIEDAGFEYLQEIAVSELPQGFLLRFAKPVE